MAEFKQTSCSGARDLLRIIAGLGSMMVALGCADILGIDPPAGKQASEDGGSDSGSDSGRGGDASAVGGAAGASGDGSAAEGGDVSAGASGMRDSVTIVGPEDTVACLGTEASIHLRASGGVPPYRWKLLESDPAFALLGANTDRATVIGTPQNPGLYPLRLQLTDATNNQPYARTFDVSVSDFPVIDQASVPTVCPGELYSVELAAHGGDASAYQWTVPDLPQSTGLSIVDGRLSGKFLGAPGNADHLDFSLHVDDGGQCAAAPVKLTLKLEKPTSLLCTTVGVQGQVSDTPPPAPCLGNPYNEKLSVRRGKGATSLKATALPLGLSFDPSTQSISGIAEGGGPLTLVVTDSASHRQIASSFELKPRDTCWLAYVSKETGSQRLRVFDALLGNRKTLPSSSSSVLTETEGVTDFKFSPDGRYLALRLSAPNGPAGLVIEKVATWQEERLLLSGVTQYEWSADSQTLAIAYNTTSGSLLTGLRVQSQLSNGPTNPSNPTPIVFPLLESTPASVDSALVWFDGDHLGFLKKHSESAYYPSTTTLAAQGFTPVSTRIDSLTPPGSDLLPAAQGVFVVPPPEGELILYYGSDGSGVVVHDGVVVAPSGRYTGRAADHSLALFRASDDSLDGTPYDQVAGCDTLLAWASGTERIACTHQLDNADDQLKIFEVSQATDKLSLFADVPLQASPGAPRVEHRRLFSPSGARLAFTGDDDALSVVSLAGAAAQTHSFQSTPAGQTPTNAFAELSFSPNEQLLLQHRGQRLSLFDVTSADLQPVPVSDALAASVGCKEDFLNRTDGWCGVERPGAPFAWAPASDLVVFEDAQGALQIYDLTWRQQGLYSTVAVHEQCTQDCVVDGQFAFQP